MDQLQTRSIVLGLVENNYVAAISLLNESYGGCDMFVHAHLSNLVNMKGLKSSFDTGGFRNLYDLVQIQNLELLGVKPDTYNRLLCLILLKLILPDLTLEFNRNLKACEMWNTDKLLNFLKNEFENREKISTIYDLDAKKSFSNDNKIEYRPKFID